MTEHREDDIRNHDVRKKGRLARGAWALSSSFLPLGLCCIGALLSLASCVDLTVPSFPVSEDDVVGMYLPSHHGTETLMVCSDHTWGRVYYDTGGVVTRDSGDWKLYSAQALVYRLNLSDMPIRHQGWRENIAIRFVFDSLAADEPVTFDCPVRNNLLQIRFWLLGESERQYYTKQ